MRHKQFTSSAFWNLRADGPSSSQLFIKFRVRTYFTASSAIILPTNNADRTSSYGIKSSTWPHTGGGMCGVVVGDEGSDTDVASLSRAITAGRPPPSPPPVG